MPSGEWWSTFGGGGGVGVNSMQKCRIPNIFTSYRSTHSGFRQKLRKTLEQTITRNKMLKECDFREGLFYAQIQNFQRPNIWRPHNPPLGGMK